MVSNMMLSPKEYLVEYLNDDLLFKLAEHLDLKSIKMLRSIFWSLANILAELPQQINRMIEFGFIDFLLNNSECILEDQILEETVAWFLSNMFREKVKINSTIKINLMNKYFPIFFSDINSMAMIEITTTIRDFLDTECEQFSDKSMLVMQRNPIERLVELGYSKNLFLKNTALEIMGKLSNNENRISDLFVREDVKEMLMFQIDSHGPKSDKQIMYNATWVISNLISDSTENCIYFSTRQLLNNLVKIIQNNISDYKSNNYSIEYENLDELSLQSGQYNVFFLIQNIFLNVGGKKFRMMLLTELNLVDLLLENLEIENWKLMEFLLEFINHILEYGTKDFNGR